MKNRILNTLTVLAIAVCMTGCTEQKINETTSASEAATQISTAAEETSANNPIKSEITDWTMKELVSDMKVEGLTFSLPCTPENFGDSFKTEYAGYSTKHGYTNAELYKDGQYIAQISFNGNVAEEDINQSSLISFFMNDVYGFPEFNILGITEHSTREDVIGILGTPNTDSGDESLLQYAFSENERIIIGFDNEQQDKMITFFIIYNVE